MLDIIVILITLNDNDNWKNNYVLHILNCNLLVNKLKTKLNKIKEKISFNGV